MRFVNENSGHTSFSASKKGGTSRPPRTTKIRLLNDFSLSRDGDGKEKCANRDFLKEKVPNYESFWKKNIVPLTNRDISRNDNRFKDILPSQFTLVDLGIAQSSYTVIRHLHFCYHRILWMRQNRWWMTYEDLLNVFTRLSGSVDLLLFVGNIKSYLLLVEYNDSKKVFDPNLRRKVVQDKKTKLSNILKLISDYRNDLAHGEIFPGYKKMGTYIRYCYPVMGKQALYRDWRSVTNVPKVLNGDFERPTEIAEKAWEDVARYANEVFGELLNSQQQPKSSPVAWGKYTPAMTSTELLDYLNLHLRNELEWVLRSAAQWDAERQLQRNILGYEVQVFAMDSTFLHSRSLFEFFTQKTGQNYYGADAFGIEPISSELYSNGWKGTLHSHLMHAQTRSQNKKLKGFDGASEKDLNQMPVDFANEIVKLWESFCKELSSKSSPDASSLLNLAKEILDTAQQHAKIVSRSTMNQIS